MAQFKNDTDFLAAYQTYSKYNVHELITELCYWREKYKVSNAESHWLDALVNTVRDPNDDDYAETEKVSSKKYFAQQQIFYKIFE